MPRLYVNQTLEKQVRQYCEANEIEDVNAFANRCLSQGLNIIKFGTSPIDNKERENNGIKDFKKNGTRRKKDSSREDEGKQDYQGTPSTREEGKEGEERGKKEEKKESVSVRKIRIIKKA